GAAPRRAQRPFVPAMRARRLRGRQGERVPQLPSGRRGVRRGARAARAEELAIARQRYNPFGGAERFVARSLPALERAGARVTLITRNEEGWGARRGLRGDPFYIR